MTTTLLQLRDRAKQESDNVGQSFLTDAEWNTLLVSSYEELYGLITEAFGNDYNVQSPSTGFTIATDGVNQFFSLPTDFFKLLGVDLQIASSNVWTTLKPFPFSERNTQTSWNNSIPMAGQTVRLFYVPKPTLPTIDASTIDGVLGWEEYIVIDAAMKALTKEESDVSILMARKTAMIKRLNSETNNRDAGAPPVTADTRGRGVMGMRYRINGNKLWLIGNSYEPFETHSDGMWGW